MNKERKFIIKKAEKSAKYLKIAISGASGFGKTYSSLLLAYGITNDWSKICILDTERKSSNLYADLGDYYVIEFNPPYSPKDYVKAISQIEQTKQFDVLIIDSVSHEWIGLGGCIDLHNKLGGKFQDWGIITPLHNKFIDKLMSVNMHVIATMRSKQDYDIGRDGDGKVNVKKLGVKPIIREGFEYEFDISFNIKDAEHNTITSKDRTGLFDETMPFVITEETGKKLKEWSLSSTASQNNITPLLINIRKVSDIKNLKKIYNENKIKLTGQNLKDFKEAVQAKKTELIKLSKIKN